MLLGDLSVGAPQFRTQKFDLLLALSIQLISPQPLLITVAIISAHFA